MALTPLYDPQNGPLRIAGLMSGSGTNLRKIIEHQRELAEKEGKSPFEMAVIFSNDIRSKAPEIGADFDIPVIIRDMRAWYSTRGAPCKDLALRKHFDAETVKALSPYGVSAAAYGGYMAVATEVLIGAFPGINVHPADLSVLDEKGRRKFVGDDAVLDAISAGFKTIASSTHIIEPEVDGGRLLMISEPIPVEIPPGADISNPDVLRNTADDNQDRLKEKGDWIIFPKTIEYIARGRFSRDENGLIHFDGKPVPQGLRLEK